MEQLESRRLLAAGGLDPYFGKAGQLYSPFSPDAAVVNAIAVQDDGKILITQPEGIARLNTDGSLDASFEGFLQDPGAIALQRDRKILVANDGGVTRLNPDGEKDLGFGDHGFASVPGGAANDLVALDNGSILVAGSEPTPSGGGTSYPAVMRLLADGRIDTTFGAAGIARPLPSIARVSEKLAIQPDGKIVVAGDWSFGGLFVSRLNDDGSVDLSFDRPVNAAAGETGGPGGISIYNGEITLSVLGTTFLAGRSLPGDNALLQVDENGHTDPSFGQAGLIETSVAGNILRQADGKFVVAGASDTGEVVISRFDPDGTPDPTFGSAGTSTINVEPYQAGSGSGLLAFARDGTILDANEVKNGGQNPVALILGVWEGYGPVAELIGAGMIRTIRPSQSPLKFKVAYRDDGRIDRSTIDGADLRVVLPDGSTRKCHVVNVAPTADSGMRIATYKFSAPGGSWDASDTGDYAVRLRPHEVADTKHHFAAARVIGTFHVNVAPQAVSGRSIASWVPLAPPTDGSPHKRDVESDLQADV